MTNSISPVSVNRNYAPNYRGEMLQKAEVLKTEPNENVTERKYIGKKQKNAIGGMIFGGLLVLATGGIYFATRGKSGMTTTTKIANTTRGSQSRPIISTDLPEVKRFLSKIQQKIDSEWELLKTLPSGNYVKKGQSYVPATNSDTKYIVIEKERVGISCKIRNKEREKIITLD